MRGRILFVVGLGVGYVLGAKAGRQRYEQIATTADKLWNSKTIAKPRAQVTEFVETQTPKVVDAATGAAKSAISKVSGKSKDA